MKRDVAYTEYAVEVNDENGFEYQVDVYSTIEEAEECAGDIKLEDGEHIKIMEIGYDENGEEIYFEFAERVK